MFSQHQAKERGCDAIWFEAVRNPAGGVSAFGEALPSWPDAEIQAALSPLCTPHELVKNYGLYRYLRENCWPQGKTPRVLEFDAGWAPVSRFWLRDLRSEQIWLADRRPGFAGFATRMGLQGHIREIKTPPENFPEFDMVFSRSEPDELWKGWLKQHLAPGGTLVYFCAKLQLGQVRIPLWAEGLQVIREEGGPVIGRAPVSATLWPPPEKICYIHAGIHKTGTTAIQELLFRQRPAFQQRGYHICRAGSPWGKMVAHHHLAYAAGQTADFHPSHGTLGQLTQELGQISAKNAILSSEEFGFTMTNVEACARLCTAIQEAGFTPRWILYFRSFPDWVDSAYAEICKSLAIFQSISGWWQTPDASARLRLGLYPYGVVEHPAVRGEYVDVRSYARATQVGLMKDFQQALGIGDIISEPEFARPANDRATGLQIEWYRLCSLMIHRYGWLDQVPRHVRAARALATILPPSPAYSGLQNQSVKEMRLRTDERYQVLLTLTGQRVEFPDFFPAKSFALEEFEWISATRLQQTALFQLLNYFMDRNYDGGAISEAKKDFFTNMRLESV